MKFLSTLWDVIYQFYNYKNGKLKFWFHMALTIVIIVFAFGLFSQNKQKNSNLSKIKQDTTQSEFNNTGKLSDKNREKRLTQAENELSSAQRKYGVNSKQAQQAKLKYSQLQSAEILQITTPTNPGQNRLKIIQDLINEYGSVSDSQLSQDFNQIYLSTGELQWVYENKFVEMLGIKGGKIALDVRDGTIYVGFQFNNAQGKTRFEKLAQLLYAHSDLAPRTNKLKITYVA